MMDILDKISQEKNDYELIGDLSNYLAYQFNNLLQIIKGNVELVLLETEESNNNFERLAEIYKAAQEGGYLTKRLIALNKEAKIIEDEKAPNGDDMTKYVKEGKEKLLVIDDNESIAKLVKQMLDKFQYEIISGENAKECLETLEKNKDINMAILDFNLPDMNGIELTKVIKEKYPDIKVILTSGYSLNTYFREIYEAGACGFLNKPFKLKELLRVIRKNLDECEKGH